MSAMENASKNAKEIFDKLTLQYNKARQARITIELIEIISGSTAAEEWPYCMQLQLEVFKTFMQNTSQRYLK